MPVSSLRWWLLVGAAGFVLLWLIQPLHDLWVVNKAGLVINQAAVAQQQAGRHQENGRDGSVTLSNTSLERVMTALSSLENVLSHARPGETPERLSRQIWRTYGAAASLAPSEHSFDLLLAAHHAGQLDRFGELRLGQVASALGHWAEAREAYRRIDATNLLISTADRYLEQGNQTAAVHFYLLAQASLEAAIQRADPAESQAASALVSSRPLSAVGAERVNALLRIGRGLLFAQQPSLAIEALEKGLALAETFPPGELTKQSLQLTLAQALAQTLGDLPATNHAAGSFSYFPNPKVTDYVLTQAQVRALIHQATETGLTAKTCVSAARALFLIGDCASAVSLLTRAMELDPLWAESYLVLGEWYRQQGLLGLAWQVYAQGKDKLPANPELAQEYALLSYHCLPPREALPLLKDAVAKGSKDPYVFAFLGDCYAALGMKQEAAETYLEGLSVAGAVSPLLTRMAKLFGPDIRSP